ncbi:MAG: type II secretion system F family protein [Actinomycetota bacterium]|nr:type II secretion system F family protein [Actinomycetota bacterium]
MLLLTMVAAAGAAWWGHEDTTSRLGRLTRGSDRRQGGPEGAESMVAGPWVEDARRRAVLCVIAWATILWLVQGPLVAVLAAVPLGLGFSWWVGTLESSSVTRARDRVAGDLPVAIDLLAACAYVGRPPDQSLTIVARAIRGPLGMRLDEINARLALGADPYDEWMRISGDAQLASLARTMLRTLESGAPLVDGLTRLAADRRRERRTLVQMRARTVGVKAAGPLAACFLPAFMLIGVVPTVASGFSRLVG